MKHHDLMEQLVEHLACMPMEDGFSPVAKIYPDGSGDIGCGCDYRVESKWRSITGLREWLAGSRLHDAEQRVIELALTLFPVIGTHVDFAEKYDLQGAADALRKLRAENG